MDYLEYYGLKEPPFANVVDNRFYYNSSQQSEALLRLKYAVDTKKGLAVLIGDIGAGKTTLARKLLESLDEETYEATLLVVIHSSVSPEWLLRKLAMQIGIADIKEEKVEVLTQIYKRLFEIAEQGKTAVIMIDEVQMLKSKEIMEEFRGLLNMELPEGKMINFIFVGMPELDSVMALDEPLKQRIAVKVHLRSLTEDSTGEYINHRMAVAGCQRKVFSPGAIKLIFRFSNGIPRLINTICDNALLEGYLLKITSLDENIVKTVAVDLGLNEESRK